MSSSASGALRLAEEYLARGDVKEALSIYRLISDTEPANPDIKRRLGELCALAEEMNHPGQTNNASTAVQPVTGGGPARSPVVQAGMASVERVEQGSGQVAAALPRSAPTNDALLVGKLAAAEILFGLGRSDRAIALLEEQLVLNPNDSRIHTKLKDIYSRSGIPQEAAGAYRQPASTDEAIQGEASPSIAGSRVRSGARSRSGLLGARRQETVTSVKRQRRSQYLVAVIGLVAVSATAGGYFLVRSNQSNITRSNTVIAQAEPLPVESPTVGNESESQAAQADDSARTAERPGGPSGKQSAGSGSNSSIERQPQSSGERESAGSTPDGIPKLENADVPKPTPPAVNPIGTIPATGGGGPNVAPGALAADAPAAAPTPVPPPTLRRAAVMSGGEVLKRVSPVYPQTAKSAHITGTVTVELSINEKGNVVSARATSGPGMLAGAAESAARGFKFKPIVLDGVPVKSSRTVLFHFKE